ncbi:MAG: hypothetical protein ACI4UE_05780 [Candidatus Scatovivens sp.]
MEQEPKTIEELKQWYVNRNLPPESVTRFFIGSNYKGAKAFGIYKDELTGKYVVYKNKADGTRAIRYEGENEEYAVNELYQKLKYEIYNQKNNNPRNYNNYEAGRYTGKSVKLISPMAMVLITILFLIILIVISLTIKTPKRGYYNYNNDYYYYQNGSWYKYDDYGSWGYTTAPQLLKENYSDYYNSYDYSYSYGISNFENSLYYEEPTSYSSSSSDYDWDSGSSWDSDYTDWDSDW